MVDTTPGVKSTEEIQREMQQTREAITEKVAALENQVLGTIQTAADTVTNTVDAVKEAVAATPAVVNDTVKQTVDTVKETVEAVKRSLSVTACVRENPLASVGASLFAGFLLGWRGGSKREVPTVAASAFAPPPPQAAAPRQPREPGLIDELVGKVRTELRELAEQSLSTLMQSLKRSVSQHVPEVVDTAVNRVSEHVQNVAQQRTHSMNGR